MGKGKYTIDNEEVTPEEAIALLKDDGTVVKTMSVEFDHPNREKVEQMELSNEGFNITKDVIGSMSEAMDAYGAGVVKMKLSNSPKIQGRHLYIIMADPDNEINEILDELLNDGEDA